MCYFLEIMPTEIDKLLAVQDLDLQIIRIRADLDKIPIIQKELTDKNQRYKDEIAAAKEAMKKVQAQNAQVELDIKGEQQRILKLREQQLQLKTNKEFKATEDEIKNIQGRISEHEDRQIGILDEVDAANKVVKAAEQELKKAEAEANLQIGEIDKRKGGLEQEVKRLSDARALAAAQVARDWLSRYEAILENKGGAALVSTEHGACGGCHMSLPPFIMHKARQHDIMVSCQFCARLLF